MRGSTLLEQLAPIEAFPTVDEIQAYADDVAARHPDRAEVRIVGSSRAGDPIQLLTLRAPGAVADVLVVGQPHPNEPIGMATIIALCDAFLADQAALEATRVNWHFMPCVDPDGTRLNEGWFRGPWSREFYARHFFRPGSEAQVEWTFPFSAPDFSVDAPMPETRALMAAIDLVKPRVMASLHNAELGGAYYYVTGGDDALYARLGALCTERGIPLHLGEPEIPICETLAPAVFSAPKTIDLYSFATTIGLDPAAIISGGSSLDWATRHGDVSALVIELPYWRDPRAEDISPSPSGKTRRETVTESIALEDAAVSELHAIFTAASPLPPGPIVDAVESFLSMFQAGWAEMKVQNAQGPEFDAIATVAEEFSAYDEIDMFRLRMGGMLLRVLPEGSEEQQRMESLFSSWCAEIAARDKSEAIPIADLVAVQGEAILATVRTAVASV